MSLNPNKQSEQRPARCEAIERHAYLLRCKQAIEMAMAVGHGLFRGCHDGLGRPLTPETQLDIAPRCGSEGFPTAEQVKQMIPQAVAAYQHHIEERLEKSHPSGLQVIRAR